MYGTCEIKDFKRANYIVHFMLQNKKDTVSECTRKDLWDPCFQNEWLFVIWEQYMHLRHSVHIKYVSYWAVSVPKGESRVSYIFHSINFVQPHFCTLWHAAISLYFRKQGDSFSPSYLCCVYMYVCTFMCGSTCGWMPEAAARCLSWLLFILCIKARTLNELTLIQLL